MEDNNKAIIDFIGTLTEKTKEDKIIWVSNKDNTTSYNSSSTVIEVNDKEKVNITFISRSMVFDLVIKFLGDKEDILETKIISPNICPDIPYLEYHLRDLYNVIVNQICSSISGGRIMEFIKNFK
jgi:hypothetical protein